MKNQAEIKEFTSRVDILEQDIYEARKAIYHELFDLRMKSISLIWDNNSPERDFNLQQIYILIFNTEKKLESLQVDEIRDPEAKKKEDEVMMEEMITDVNQNSSISSEEAGDDSLNLEFINPSFLFDEEKDDSSSDVVRLIPSIVDGVGDVGEIQKRDSRFIAYQEGKLFIPKTEFVVNFPSRKITAHEENGFTLKQILNDEIVQLECQNCIIDDNLNQSVSHILTILKMSSILFISGVTSSCVVLPNLEYGRMIFDRGKEIVDSEICSYCTRRNFRFYIKMFAYWLAIPMENCDGESFYELILTHGYQLNSKFTNLVMFVLVKHDDSCNGKNLFAKISSRDCITSYACVGLLFDQYRMPETSLWNSYPDVLVIASSELFQKLLNYMGNNNYELVLSNTSSYVIASATELVKTSRGDNKDSDTMIADKVHSVVIVKLRYDFLKMSGKVMRSLRSADGLNGGRNVYGKVFDRGRLIDLIKRYSYYIRSSSKINLELLFVELEEFLLFDKAEQPNSFLQCVMLFNTIYVSDGKVLSQRWLGVLNSEDVLVTLHVYSLMKVSSVVETYGKLFKLKRGYRRVKCCKRKVEIMERLVVFKDGESITQELLGEVFKVVCFLTQLEVAVLKLTRICHLIKALRDIYEEDDVVSWKLKDVVLLDKEVICRGSGKWDANDVVNEHGHIQLEVIGLSLDSGIASQLWQVVFCTFLNCSSYMAISPCNSMKCRITKTNMLKFEELFSTVRRKSLQPRPL